MFHILTGIWSFRCPGFWPNRCVVCVIGVIVLICNSLISDDVEYFFYMLIFHLYIFYLRCLLKFLAILKLFLYCCV